MPKDKQMINNKFFKEWSSNMAYVLGFVVADGCVMKRKDRKDSFIFNITTKDREHLENIQKAMCSKYQIGLKSGGGSRERNISFVQITNKEICLDLINLGVIPRKTYNLGEIKIPDEYFADFARGFFDGDGTVYIYNEMVAKLFRSEILDFRARRGRRAKCFEAVAQLRRKAFCEV